MLARFEQSDLSLDAALAVVRETVDRRDLIFRLAAALGIAAGGRGVLALRQEVLTKAPLPPSLEPIRRQFLVECRALIYGLVHNFEASFGRDD